MENDFGKNILGVGATHFIPQISQPKEPVLYNVIVNINKNIRTKIHEDGIIAGSTISPESTQPQCHITATQTVGQPTIYVSLNYIPSEVAAVIDHCYNVRNVRDDIGYPFRMRRMVNLMETHELSVVSFLNHEFTFDENCNYKLNVETFDIEEFQKALVNRLKRFKEIAKEIEAYAVKEYDVYIKDVFNEN